MTEHNRELFQHVRELNLPIGEYALFGSAPLGIRGLRRCSDVDVIVSSRLFEELRRAGTWEVRLTPEGSDYLARGDVEVRRDWRPGKWDIKKLVSEAEMIDGLPFVALECVLEWKKIRQEEKDVVDIDLIEQFLGSWKFYISPPPAWSGMFKDCAAAEKTIDFESYIFSADRVGLRFIELFKKKAKDGVRVRMLLDMVGSYGFFNSSEARALQGAGVEVRFFNPIRPWRIGTFSSFFHRDHRKVLVVDSRVGYAGGVNVAERMANWRDTHVRIEGAVVHEMQYAFERMWAAAYEKSILRKFKKPHAVNSHISFLTSAPHLRQRFVYRNMLKALREARVYAYFTTPYFVPSILFFGTLTAAAKRGVDVRILLPEKSDVRTADIASGAYFAVALKSGVRIYRYQGSILHVKTAVIDDKWGIVGSVNLDNLSLLSNYEGNLVSRDASFIQQIKNHFLKDIAASHEVRSDVWARRPVFRKFLETISWPLHRIL